MLGQHRDLTHASGEPVWDVSKLSKTYGTGISAKTAIQEVSFTVQRTELLSIVGPSGAGKTTLLKCLCGLIPPTSGTVLFEGTTYKGVPPRLALVFQDYARSLFPWLSVESNITLPLRNQGISRKEQRKRAKEMLHAVGLKDCERRYPWQLSGGMQQRVAIARALAYQPDCLLMDEPFASVDAQTRADLEDLLLMLRRSFGITVVFVTHDIDEAIYLSDTVIALSTSPCVVRETLRVQLPEPRDQVKTKALEEYTQLRSELVSVMRSFGQHDLTSVGDEAWEGE